MKSIGLVVLITLLCYTEAYKILVCYPLYVKSLSILGQGIVRHLLNAGHEVTYITTFPLEKVQTTKFRQIDISSINVFQDDGTLSIGYILDNKVADNDLIHAQAFARENARLTFQHENVTALLENTEEHFDAVIVDLFESEIYAGLAVVYNCPMMWVFSMGAHWQVLRLLTDIGSPAYDNDYYGYNLPPFTFRQRLEELWARIRWNYYKTFVTTPIERDIYKEAFGPLLAKRGRELPKYEDVVFNASFIFGNEHNAMSLRPSTPQNFKFIGGFHIEDPPKLLSELLQDIMDTAPHGVIYFSMGSFWQSKEIPKKLTRELLNVFSELKVTVIWKYEDVMYDVPKNVHLTRWAPQQSILAHPKCKLFISHGGLLSSIEAVHFGVPIIGIPVLFDQHINVNKAVTSGYAIKVDLNYNLPQNLKAAINTMLTNKTYRQNAKRLSSIYHDVPVKPGVELAHWIRHVILTRGAPHLRSPAWGVPLYQRLYLDLAALLLGILFILNMIIRKITKRNNKNILKEKRN